MARATVLLFMLLLAACSDENPPKQALNEMIESPLQNTVISSFDHYPPRPVEPLIDDTPTSALSDAASPR
jgi:PBP1b-binding outer membrane lipoprotein LpoB